MAGITQWSKPGVPPIITAERDIVGPGPTLAGRLTIGSWDRMRNLLALRAERGELAAIERRIADFIVENPLCVRDRSSQQLANTLAVSQSSVVKFAKRLGYRGYPDMKLSITEAMAREAACNGTAVVSADPDMARAEALSRGKAAADDETRALNPPELLAAAVRRLAEIAYDVNERTENIGARRLATVMERLLDEVSFDAPNRAGQTVTLDAAAVNARLADLSKNEDLSRYIL